MKQPIHQEIICESGRRIYRLNNLYDVNWYDDFKNNPNGYYNRNCGTDRQMKDYNKEKFILTASKRRILLEARKGLTVDKDFQELIYQEKSNKRKAYKNKFGGNFLPVQYARSEEKIFERHTSGKIAPTINMAFQVGTFAGGNYTQAFTKIVKAILMAQAMGVKLNIDMFDSDTRAVRGGGYIVVNVAKSSEKLDFNKILMCSDNRFFQISLFNAYSCQDLTDHFTVGTFLQGGQITRDLSPYYDVIGGNITEVNQENPDKREMVSKLIKVAMK